MESKLSVYGGEGDGIKFRLCHVKKILIVCVVEKEIESRLSTSNVDVEGIAIVLCHVTEGRESQLSCVM